MNEYELYRRILAPRLIADNQKILIEKKTTKIHKATIIDDSIDSYIIYRYDMDEMKDQFLPFFNKTDAKDGKKIEYPAPQELNSFCDYILLASKGDRLFVILIEMKSGYTDGADLQLKATECFMGFIKDTAERIKNKNGYRDFSANNIVVKRVVLQPVPKSRPSTNKAKSNKVDFSAHIVKLTSDTFPIHQFCR